ncbi:nitronate monooxygenase [Gordonia sp. CPCC 206044]|uniref:NAD(P)H-dependent flavin oxidoreductase n=1 Tax=Gordonia sp. CPCC 206044 TaxID=3140793 RepID=UPI003AF376DD
MTDRTGGPMRIGELEVALPIVCAPMAGGPTTPALVAGVGKAGGLGMLAAGYLGPEVLDGLATEVEALTDRPYGVNLFVSGPQSPAGPDGGSAVADYRAEIDPDARRFDVALGEPRYTDEFVDDKLEVLSTHRPAVVSFTFGDPGAAVVRRVHETLGVPVAVTVTSIEEARTALSSGADALVAQGIEAGGHRGIWVDDPTVEAGGPRTPTVELVRRIVAEVDVPVLAAGGIGDGAAIRAVCTQGAVGAQLGTAFLCSDEAGTSDAYRRALLKRSYVDTVVTRAFSGRSARSLRNGFAARHVRAPAAYPYVHHLTKPLRAAAAAAGDSDHINLWAGTAWRSVTTGPVAAIMARLTAELLDEP